MKRATCITILILWPCLAGIPAGCSPDEPNPLDSMEQVNVQIGEHTFKAWLADDPDERERGLMHVTADQMAPLPDGTERAMVFVFAEQQQRGHGFWMKNTIIPLDIAFIRTDGTIANIRTMAPLDTRGYFAKGPYRYALEVRGNLFSELKIKSGDMVRIPDSLLKHAR